MKHREMAAVMGALVGDAAGAVLEFVGRAIEPADVADALSMPGGGIWNVASGQVTDDGELTMSLLRALVEDPERPTERAAIHYAHWVATDPFDIGATTAASLGCLRDPALARLAESEGAFAVMTVTARKRCMPSKANGSLMRATPLAAWGAARDANVVARATASDARLSHPNPACVGAAVAYVQAARHLILNEGDAEGAFAAAEMSVHEPHRWSRDADTYEEVAGWLADARANVLVPYSPQDGFVRIGFTHAFRHLLLGTPYLAALEETLLGGGDSDTNACIVGGLLGARFGLEAIPESMRSAVLQCRPAHNRPAELHPRQVPDLIARL